MEGKAFQVMLDPGSRGDLRGGHCYMAYVKYRPIIFLCLLSAFSVVSLIISIVALMDAHNDVFSLETPCVECGKLSKTLHNQTLLHIPLLELIDKKYEGGVNKCCVSTNKLLSALIELSRIEPRESNKDPLPTYNPADFKFSPVSAHKRLYAPEFPFPVVFRDRVPHFIDKPVYLLFKSNKFSPDPLLEHERGVEVISDRLRIMYSGLYFVYSSIHFRPESTQPCKDFQYQVFSLYVVNVTPNDSTKTGNILRITHTCCNECQMYEETSYVGGVFQLEAGNDIQIAISGYGLFHSRQQSSFAGLFMIGLANP